MNITYKVIWNAALGIWVAVSEFAKNRIKSSVKPISYPSSLKKIVKKFPLASGGLLFLTLNLATINISWANVYFQNSPSSNSGDTSCTWIADDASTSLHVSNGNSTVGCSPSDVATQTSRSMFYSSSSTISGFGDTRNLSLGGELYVNAGKIGVTDLVGSTYSMRLGSQATLAATAGTNAIALGSSQTSTTDGASSIGTIASGNQSIAIGSRANSSNVDDVALGTLSTASGGVSVALGGYSSATGANSIAIGNKAITSTSAGVAIGSGAVANNANDVALGAGSTTAASVSTSSATIGGTTYNFAGTSPSSVVSVGSAGSERLVTNVAAGRISSSSTDAINGSQLFATNSAITSAATTANKGWNIQTNSDTATNIAPGDTVKLNDGQNIKLTSNGSTVTVATADDLVASSLTAGNTLVNTNGVTFKGGSTVSLSNSGLDNGGNVITNVGKGSLSAASTDAVNGAQLFDVQQQASQPLTFAGDSGPAASRNLGDTINIKGGATQTLTTGNIGVVSNGTDTLNVQLAKDVDLGTDGSLKAGSTSLSTSGLTAGNTQVSTTGVTNGNMALTGTGLALTNPNDSTKTVSLSNSGLNNGDNIITGVAAGNLASNSTDAVNGAQLYTVQQQAATANKGWNIQTNSDTATNIAPGDTVKLNDGQNIKLTSNGSTITVATADDLVVSSLTAGNTLVGTNGVTFKGGSTVSLSSSGLDNGGNVITNVGNGLLSANSTDAVNGGQLYTVQQQATNANKGWNIQTNDDTATNVAPGGTVQLKNGQNIKLTSNDSTITVATADDLVINSLTLGNTLVDSDGVKLSGGSNNTVSLSNNGLDNGNNKIINVAAGTEANDAVNYSQLTSAISGVRTHYYGVNDGGITGGNYNGEGATGNYAVVAGVSASATASGSTAIGSSSQAQASGATAIGYQAQSTATGSVALGSNASDNGRGAETYTGAYSNAANVTVGTVSIGNAETGETRTLSNVADAKQSTDAVNLRQLDGAVQTANNYTDTQVAKVNQQGSDNANNISLLSNGKDGYFQVNNTDNYAKPTASGENSFAGGSGAKASSSYSIALGTNAAATSANSVALGSNSVADRENSVSVGSSGKERQITHVAAGTEDTDAVNVKQLKSSEQGSVRYASNQDGSTNYSQVTLGDGQTPTTLSNVAPGTSGTDAVNVNQMKQGLASANRYTDHAVGEVRKDAFSGVAAAIATANLPQSYVPGGSMTSVGLGSYQGQSALAVGVSTVSDNGRWVLKLSGTTSSRGDTGVGAGVGLQW
ncbi:YadA-like family protein [Rosenbergiella epipactidis]|uniref:YadA-like family protein n=1 Tax=Rosenbergiella epipactidis TaxID=1544694 RepID=UPI001F4FBAC7|nr:YadA-like family protein [Rosenbergiella epipactidis]